MLQVGQCGNQLGTKFWDVLLQEQQQAAAGLSPNAALDSLQSLFYETNDGTGVRLAGPKVAGRSSAAASDTEGSTVKARCVAVDMEEGVLNAMMRGPMAPLFDTCHFVSDVSGAGNNWAVGHMEFGDKYVGAIEESVRTMVERCDSLQTFIVTHSLSGGTGSGLGTRCLSMLEDVYPHVFRCATVVMPGEVEDVVTAPYNTCFALREVIEHASCVIPLDNDALAAAADRSMGTSAGGVRGSADVADTKFNVALPTRTKLPFDSMNAIAAQMLSNLTCSMRFPGSLNMDINEIATNLVPYPRLHFLLSAISPLSVSKKMHVGGKDIDSMFSALLEPDHQLLHCAPRNSTFLGSAFVCRGTDIGIDDITRNVPRMRERMRMVYWNSDGFKTALCGVPPLGHQRSALMLSNHCGIADTIARLRDKFMQLYRVRSHVHHYSEYLELPFFDDTMDIVGNVVADYSFLNTVQPPARPPRSLRELVL
jgi:tubulin epsilon